MNDESETAIALQTQNGDQTLTSSTFIKAWGEGLVSADIKHYVIYTSSGYVVSNPLIKTSKSVAESS